jgi:hypothetical protein
MVGSFLAAGVLVYTSTTSALASGGSARASHDVLHVNDDIGRTHVDVAAMIPGDSVSGCVQVTHRNHAPAPAAVRVHGVSAGTLSEHLALTIHHGVVGSDCEAPGPLTVVYDGPLQGFGADYATGSVGQAPSIAPAVVAYPFTLTLAASTPNSAQGAHGTVELRWETRTDGPTA